MAIVLHVINTPDTPNFSTVLSAPAPHDPPEVVKLVADTETAFQQDDYKAARNNITALQQIAPTHPRLPFFEALLAKHEAATTHETRSSVIGRWFSRHASSAPRPKSVTPVRSAPDVKPPVVSTFSGKTLEDSNSAAGNPPPSLTQEPEVIKRFPPDYPGDAAEKGIEGAVDLSFVVSPAGDVHDVTVVHAEPSAIFNRAATTAVRRWKYQPRKVNGVAVEAHVQLRMTFKLDGRG
jgi:TonB family protein